MLPKVHIVDINIDIPFNAILKRLGYSKTASSMQSCQIQNYMTIIEEAASFIRMRGSYAICDFQPTSEGICLETGDRLNGILPQIMAKSAKKVLLMAATAGTQIMETIGELQKTDMAKSVIYDATASEITDSGLDWIMKYTGTLLKRHGLRVNRSRFSPGYGDLELQNQKKLYRLLELDKLGVSITESCILIPEKSVIAIAGII